MPLLSLVWTFCRFLEGGSRQVFRKPALTSVQAPSGPPEKEYSEAGFAQICDFSQLPQSLCCHIQPFFSPFLLLYVRCRRKDSYHLASMHGALPVLRCRRATAPLFKDTLIFPDGQIISSKCGPHSINSLPLHTPLGLRPQGEGKYL